MVWAIHVSPRVQKDSEQGKLQIVDCCPEGLLRESVKGAPGHLPALKVLAIA
jgi:hypothetical protein